jgi:acetyl-CoA acyltransferase
MKESAYLIDGVRTPVGNFGGTLAAVRADDMAACVLKELLQRNVSVDPKSISDVILGCANQAGEDNRNVARMALFLAG